MAGLTVSLVNVAAHMDRGASPTSGAAGAARRPPEGAQVPSPTSEAAWERSLAVRIAGGDVHAYAALLNRFWQPLVRYAAYKLGSQDAAEDVVQEAFVRLWAKRSTLKARTSPRGYLYRVSHNLVITELRKRRVRATHAHLLMGNFPPHAPPGPAIERDELAEAATRALEALAPRRRDVLVLAYFHGLTYREIAHTMRISPRTVANHMTLALRDLRQALQRFIDTTGV
ncbi:MAG TPA: RNA polymerase sigma-70 factor [Longimicrobiales bacterium]|nr:RNA polymerase sigma-70 factor [Longimicrobiales bacterium]